MKKLLLLSVFFLGIYFVNAQNVPRQMVAVEVGTGTWCPYCPSATMGVEDLLENGCSVAVIENHGSDAYAWAGSNARNALYNNAYFPSAGLDGMLGYVGGNGSTSNYPYFVTRYNTRKAITSPVDLVMEETHDGINYNFTLTITKVGNVFATTTKLFFFVTESHIPKIWMNQTECNFVNRKMLPDPNGTVINFTSGNTQVVNLTLAFDTAHWKIANCEFVALVQNVDVGQGYIPGTAQSASPPYPGMNKNETYQAIKRGVIDLTPDFSVDTTEVTTNQPVTYTNETTGGYQWNVPVTYQWTFPGATPETSTDENPTVSYADAGTYDVTLIVNRGGQIDTITKTSYITVNFPVGMQENLTLVKTRISPNPSNGIFTLDVYSGKTVNVNVSVVNSVNIPVYQESGISFTNRYTQKIDLSNLAKGLYFVMVETEGHKTVNKLIIN